MSGKLFLNSVECTGGSMLLGFAVGEPVVLGDAEKRRDLPDGSAEYAMTASSGSHQFEVRCVADSDGNVEKVIASAAPIPDDWHEDLEQIPKGGQR